MSRQDCAVLKESSLGAVRTTGPAWRATSAWQSLFLSFFSFFLFLEGHLRGSDRISRANSRFRRVVGRP